MSASPVADPTDLVLLTARYPFDDHEVVLDPEVALLAERFRRVFLLPSVRGKRVRPLPPNVSLTELDWFDQWPRGAKLRALASREALAVLFVTLRRPRNWRPYLANWRFYLDLLAINVLKSRVLRRFVEEAQLEQAIFYDYWFENSTLALALLRRSGTITIAVCRAHNFDIYDEDWAGKVVPFREFKARELDLVLPISEHGARYLRDHVPVSAKKTPVAYLGVEQRSPGPGRRSGPPLIVSCARLEPRKRIHLIPQALAKMRRPLRWIHLGDGADRSKVEAAAARLPEGIDWQLRGQIDNEEVLAFYRDNHVDALLSLSVSEGVPISMMEAQSFGIPIIATAVRGVPEIVSDRTGLLLQPSAGVDEVAAAIDHALEPGRFDRDEIVDYFRDHFEARRNHSEFVDRLVSLRRDEALEG